MIVVDMLVAAGADINAKNISDQTALMNAAIRPEAVRAFVRLGADVTLADCNGYTALCYAKDKEVVDRLVAAGADVDAKAEYGITPLMNACCPQFDNNPYLSIEAACALLGNGASVNIQDDYGKTALNSICSEYCNCVVAMVDLLLRSGADERIADSHGRLPVDCLLSKDKYEREKIVQARHLLISAPQGRAWRRRGLLLMYMARNAGTESSVASWLMDARAGQEGIFRTVVGYV